MWGLTSFVAYYKLPICVIVLQIVFLQMVKLVCLIISVLEYFPVDASCKTFLFSLDDNALGLPPEFFSEIITQLQKIINNSSRSSYSPCYSPTTQQLKDNNSTIIPFTNNVNLFALGIL